MFLLQLLRNRQDVSLLDRAVRAHDSWESPRPMSCGVVSEMLICYQNETGRNIWSHGFLSMLPSKICGGSRKSMQSVDVFTEYILVKVCLTLVYCIKNTFSNSTAANECH